MTQEENGHKFNPTTIWSSHRRVFLIMSSCAAIEAVFGSNLLIPRLL